MKVKSIISAGFALVILVMGVFTNQGAIVFEDVFDIQAGDPNFALFFTENDSVTVDILDLVMGTSFSLTVENVDTGDVAVAGVIGGNNTGATPNFTHTFVAPSDGTYLFTVNVLSAGNNQDIITIRVDHTRISTPRDPHMANCHDVLADGRLNDDATWHCAAPVAVYPNGEFYAINHLDSEESLLEITLPEDVMHSDAPETNTLIAEAMHPYTGFPIKVYHLTTGEFQMNTQYWDGKPYIAIWRDIQLYPLDV